MKVYRSKKAGLNIIRTYDALVKEWGISVKELDLSTRYGVIHVITAGEDTAKPLILFHGVGDDSAMMWLYNAKALAKHYKIYAMDTLGGPGKSRIGEGYNEDFRDPILIEEIMNMLNLKKASFVGVSNGGYLVQSFLLRKPEMVDKAISISAGVPCGYGNEKGLKRNMLKIFLPEALFPTKKNAIKLLKKMSGDNVKVFTENELLLEHFQYLLKGFNQMGMRYHHVVPFTEDEILQIKDKVFYLTGDQDLFAKFGGKDAQIRYGTNTHFYPHAGHGLNHEEAEAINQMIVDIIEGKVKDIRNYNS